MGINPVSTVQNSSLFSTGNTTTKFLQQGKGTNGLQADTFQKQSAALKQQEEKISHVDLARKFKKNVLSAFEDWKTALPHDGAEGSSVVKQHFPEYTKHLESMPNEHVKHFVNLVFGKEKLEVLEQASQVNSHVKEFVGVIEKAAGDSLKNMINNLHK